MNEFDPNEFLSNLDISESQVDTQGFDPDQFIADATQEELKDFNPDQFIGGIKGIQDRLIDIYSKQPQAPTLRENPTIEDLTQEAAYSNWKQQRDEILKDIPQDLQQTLDDRARISVSKDFPTFLKETLSVGGLVEAAPFIGAMKQTKYIEEVKLAADRLRDGIETQSDRGLLQDFKEDQNKPHTLAYNVFNVLKGSATLGLEFFTTAGVFSEARLAGLLSARKSIEWLLKKEGTKALEDALAKSAIGRTAKGFAKEAVGATAGALAQSAIIAPSKIITEALYRATPTPTLNRDELGEQALYIDQDGEDLSTAIPKAIWDQFTEVWTERFGGIVDTPIKGALSRVAKTGIIKKFFEKYPKADISVFTSFLKKAGWNGLIGEISEEEWGKALKAFAGTEEYKVTTPRELMEEAIAFSIPGALGQTYSIGAGIMKAKLAKAEYDYFQKRIGNLQNQLNEINSNQDLAPATAEQARQEVLNELGEVADLSKDIELPEEEQKAFLGSTVPQETPTESATTQINESTSGSPSIEIQALEGMPDNKERFNQAIRMLLPDEQDIVYTAIANNNWDEVPVDIKEKIINFVGDLHDYQFNKALKESKLESPIVSPSDTIEEQKLTNYDLKLIGDKLKEGPVSEINGMSVQSLSDQSLLPEEGITLKRNDQGQLEITSIQYKEYGERLGGRQTQTTYNEVPKKRRSFERTINQEAGKDRQVIEQSLRTEEDKDRTMANTLKRLGVINEADLSSDIQDQDTSSLNEVERGAVALAINEFSKDKDADFNKYPQLERALKSLVEGKALEAKAIRDGRKKSIVPVNDIEDFYKYIKSFLGNQYKGLLRLEQIKENRSIPTEDTAEISQAGEAMQPANRDPIMEQAINDLDEEEQKIVERFMAKEGDLPDDLNRKLRGNYERRLAESEGRGTQKGIGYRPAAQFKGESGGGGAQSSEARNKREATKLQGESSQGAMEQGAPRATRSGVQQLDITGIGVHNPMVPYVERRYLSPEEFNKQLQLLIDRRTEDLRKFGVERSDVITIEPVDGKFTIDNDSENDDGFSPAIYSSKLDKIIIVPSRLLTGSQQISSEGIDLILDEEVDHARMYRTLVRMSDVIESSANEILSRIRTESRGIKIGESNLIDLLEKIRNSYNNINNSFEVVRLIRQLLRTGQFSESLLPSGSRNLTDLIINNKDSIANAIADPNSIIGMVSSEMENPTRESTQTTGGYTPAMAAFNKLKRIGLEQSATARLFGEKFEKTIDWNNVKTPKDLEKYLKTSADPGISRQKVASALADQANVPNNEAANQFRADPERAINTVYDEITRQREQSIKEWTDYMESNDEYKNDPYWKTLIFDMLEREFSSDKNYGLGETLPLNAGVLADLRQSIEKLPINVNINLAKLYRRLLLENTKKTSKERVKTGNIKEWVYIPSKEEDEVNFSENVKKLQALSHNNWCTRSYNAEPYLSRGGFWILTVGNDPVAAIRLDGDKIAEIQGEKNNGAIPPEYSPDIAKLLEAKKDQLKNYDEFAVKNPNTSSEELLRIYNSFDKEPGSIMLDFIKNPSTPTIIFDDYLDKTVIKARPESVFKSGKWTGNIRAFYKNKIASDIIERANVSPEILRKIHESDKVTLKYAPGLVEQGDWYQSHLIKNPNTPSDVLVDIVSGYYHPDVGFYVAINRNTPIDIVDKILENKDVYSHQSFIAINPQSNIYTVEKLIDNISAEDRRMRKIAVTLEDPRLLNKLYDKAIKESKEGANVTDTVYYIAGNSYDDNVLNDKIFGLIKENKENNNLVISMDFIRSFLGKLSYEEIDNYVDKVGDNSPLLEAISDIEGLSPESYRKSYNHLEQVGDYHDMGLLARHPEVPQDILINIAKNATETSYLNASVASNPSSPSEALDIVFDKTINNKIDDGWNLSEDELNGMYTDRGEDVDWDYPDLDVIINSLASHKNSSPRILSYLLKKAYPNIALFAAKNPNSNIKDIQDRIDAYKKFGMKDNRPFIKDLENIINDRKSQVVGPIAFPQIFNNTKDAPEPIKKEIRDLEDNPPTFFQNVKDWYKNFSMEFVIHKIMDGYYSIKLNEMLYNKLASGEDVLSDAARSGYKLAIMSRDAEEWALSIINSGIPIWKDGSTVIKEGSRGLTDIFGDVEKELGKDGVRDLQWYMAALRAQELKKQGKEILFTDERINEILKLRTQERAPIFDKAIKEYQEYMDGIMDFMVQSGLVTKELGKKLRDMYRNYVPFYRVIDTWANERYKGFIPKSKRELSDQSNGIKRIKGSDKQINDLFENIQRNIVHSISASIRNEALKRVIATDLAIGEMTKTKDNPRGNRFTQRVGGGRLANIKMSDIIDELIAKGVDPKALENLNEDELTNLWSVGMRPKGTNVISVMVDGRRAYYKINDPLMFESLAHVNKKPHFLNGFMGAVWKLPKRMVQLGVTLYPDFYFRNIIKDGMTAWLQNAGVDTPFSALGGSYEITKSYLEWLKQQDPILHPIQTIKDFKNAHKYNPNIEQIMNAGAGNPTLFKNEESTITGIAKAAGDSTVYKVVTSPAMLFNLLEKFASASEVVTRLGAANNALKKGATPAEAAWIYRSSTVDFSITGSSKTIQLIAEVTPFFRAQLQGMYKTGTSIKENPTNFAIKAMPIIFATTALAVMNHDDDRYKRLTDKHKAMFWHIFFDKDGESYDFMIPKPFDAGGLLANYPESLTYLFMEWMKKDLDPFDYQYAKQRLWEDSVDAMRVWPIPPLLSIPTELGANYNFYLGRKIVPSALENLPPSMQYNIDTSELAKDIGERLNISPLKIEHLSGALLGSMGRYGLQTVDGVYRAITNSPERPAKSITEGPIARVFLRRTKDEPGRYVSDFYDISKEAEAKARQINQLVRDGEMDVALKIYKEDPSVEDRNKFLRKVRESLTEINKIQRLIYLSRDLTAAEKREQIEELRAKKESIAKMALEVTKPFRNP